jgi:hypothetical protein
MGPLNLALLPGQRLGPFNLGDELVSVLEFLKGKSATYPCVEISRSQVGIALRDYCIVKPASVHFTLL